jgi:hypothetical protein
VPSANAEQGIAAKPIAEMVKMAASGEFGAYEVIALRVR